MRNLAIFALSGIISAIILLSCTGTIHYMTGAYYRYFRASIEMVQKLYNGGQQK
jgi:hypothetical protein